MSLIAHSLIALQDNSLTMPLLTEISSQKILKKYKSFNCRTLQVSKNNHDEMSSKFLESIYNKETLWGKTTAKQQRIKKRKGNKYIDVVDETVESIDQLLTNKANSKDIENSVKKSHSLNITTSNMHQNIDKMYPLGPIFGNAVRNNEQDIPESIEQNNYSLQHEIQSSDTVDANERNENTNEAKTVPNTKTIQVVKIERMQRQTIQFQNSVPILLANSTNTPMSLNIEEIFPQDIEMTDLDNSIVINTPNSKVAVNNNSLQYNSVIDLGRYCLGCKRKLAMESEPVEIPSAKRPRIEPPVQDFSRLETANHNNIPSKASPIPTIVSRNNAPNTNNVLVPVPSNTSSDYRNNNHPNNQNRNSKRPKHKSRKNVDLNVEITTANRRKLSYQETLFIQEELSAIILESASNASEDSPDILVPRFNGKPVHTKGVLKLWCEDTITLIWLKNSITLLPVPDLVVKRQCDKFIRIQFIKAGIFIPRIYYEKYIIIRILKFMNPWAAVETWSITGVKKHGDYVLFKVGIPFEIIGQILDRDCVIRCMIGTLRVRFFKGKKLVEIPHDLINGPRVRVLHRRPTRQHFPVQNWVSRLPRHQFDF